MQPAYYLLPLRFLRRFATSATRASTNSFGTLATCASAALNLLIPAGACFGFSVAMLCILLEYHESGVADSSEFPVRQTLAHDAPQQIEEPARVAKLADIETEALLFGDERERLERAAGNRPLSEFIRETMLAAAVR